MKLYGIANNAELIIVQRKKMNIGVKKQKLIRKIINHVNSIANIIRLPIV